MKLFQMLGAGALVSLLLTASNASFCATPSDAILNLLHITPSGESVDYVLHKKQFQLQNLVTEQRQLSDQ